MGQKLLQLLHRKFLFFALLSLLIALGGETVYGQTILAPGDVVFVGIDAGSGGSFEFIPLVDLEAGTVIHFTATGWNRSESAFAERGNLLTYRAPEDIRRGSVVTYRGEKEAENGFTNIGFRPDERVGHILAYQGTADHPRFICGAGWSVDPDTDVWTYDDTTPTPTGTDIPAVLNPEEGTIVQLESSVKQRFNTANPLEGTKSEILKQVGNTAAWSEFEGDFPEFSWNFSLTTPSGPVVAFAMDSLTVNEGAGSVSLDIVLLEAAETAVEAELHFIGPPGSAVLGDDRGDRIQRVRFGADAEAGTVKSVVIPITDDDEQEGMETAVFQLKNVSGGIAGESNILLLAVTDNDTRNLSLNFGGREGWRMITAPVRNMTFLEVLDDIRIEGIPESYAPENETTIFYWEETDGEDGLKSPESLSETMVPGVGYMVYLFEDDDPGRQGVQGGFPKKIEVDNIDREVESSVQVEVSATDHNENGRIDGNEGWNLLGNPFGVSVSVAALLDELEINDAVLNRNLYIWDASEGDGNGVFRTLTDGDRLAPFQAFFVRYTGEHFFSENITLNRNNLNADDRRSYYNENSNNRFELSLRIEGSPGYDEFSLVFSDDGEMNINRRDRFKKLSLNSGSLSLYGRFQREKFSSKRIPGNLETGLEIPLGIDYPDEEELTFLWEGIDQLPRNWTVTLIDRKQNIRTDLRTQQEYRFLYEMDRQARRTLPDVLSGSRLNRRVAESSSGSDDPPRFILSINPGTDRGNVNEQPASVKLQPNFPNPFNSSTTVTYELTEQSEVSLTIWNMIGQKVATLVDGPREAGEHSEIWNASNMPSGMYIAQLEVDGRVYIRKMTLIK